MSTRPADCAIAPAGLDPEGRQGLVLRIGDDTMDLWLRADSGPGDVSGDVGLALSLLPAMKHGGALRVDPDLSPRLLAASQRIQDLFLMWERGDALPPQGFRRIRIDADRRAPDGPGGTGVGCFFSGGVDSFYTVLAHEAEITDLVLVHGFDVPLGDRPLREEISRAARAVAAELGKRLIEVDTNVRDIADRHLTWHHFFGAGLASVALFLAPQLRKVFVPGAHTHLNLVPDGSHPLLDPLWSTERLEIVYDGLEATRTDKIAHLARNALAMRWLRVCWKNPDGAYNCGRCEKCMRTLISLRAVGAAGACATLKGPLDLDAVRAIEPGHARTIWAELLSDLETLQADPALIGAVRAVAEPSAFPGVRTWRRLRRVASRVGSPRPGSEPPSGE